MPAVAQSSPSDSEALAEIIVTAQKREQSAQDVPIAITVLGSEEILNAGVTSTDELRTAVPALNFTKGSGGFGLPRIRGLGATGQGNGIENPVAVYVDGVYYAASSGVLMSLFDIEQVAVLKGPQGTLFGRNATGGLIDIKTLNPSLVDSRFKAEVGYGNFETMTANGFFSAPLTANLGVSLSGQWEERGEGFGRNIYTGNHVQDASTYAGRAKVLFEPGDSTRLLLSADINGTDDTSPAFVNFGLNTLGEDVPAVIAAAGGDPEYDILADVDPDLKSRQWGASLTVEQGIGGLTLRSISAYRKTNLDVFFDPDGTTNPTLRILNVNEDETFTQELDLLSSSDGRFTWVIGGFYMWNVAGQYPGRTTGTTNPSGSFGTGYSDEFNSVSLNSWSGFAEGTYGITDATNLTAGLRYTDDARTLEARRVVFNGATGATTTTDYPNQRRDFSEPSWRLTLDHRFTPDLMAYASYNRGFRAGTFVPQAQPVSVLEPELVDAYEIGIKSDLLDRRLRVNLAGYYYDQSSVQVQQVIAGVQNVYSARGGAEIYGVDGDFAFQATDHLRFFGGFSWNEAHYNDFTDAIISIPFPVPATTPPFSTTQYSYVDPVTGNTIVNTACLGTFVPPNITTQAGRDAFYRGRPGGNCLLRGDASGNRLQNSPQFAASLGGSLDMPTQVGTFSLAANVYYNDGYVGTADERVTQDSFLNLNASLGWRSSDDRFYATLWGANLTDDYYRTQLSASNSGDNGPAGAPLTFGLKVGVDF
jgi:iron complex outermembrane receptor protein